MSRFRVGIIIFNDNTASTFRTLLKLLNASVKWRDEIKISLICCGENVKEGEVNIHAKNISELNGKTFEEMLSIAPEEITDENLYELAEKNEVSFYFSGAFSDLLKKAVCDMDVDYVHMTMSNVTYTEKYWTEIFQYIHETPADVFTTKVKALNPSPVIKEHNGYVTKMSQLGERTEDGEKFYVYHIIHEIFYSYFIKKENLMLEVLPNVAEKLHWTLDVVYLYICSLASIDKIDIVPSAMFILHGKTDLIDWKFLADNETARFYLSDFLEGLSCFCSNVTNNKNAKYNLLYFLKKQIANYPKDESDVKIIQEKVEEILSSIQEEELILENQYYDRVLKKYILEKFEWKEEQSFPLKQKKEEINDDGYLENTLIFAHLTKNKLVLEGRSMMHGEEPFDIYVDCNGDKIECNIINKKFSRKWFDTNIALTEYYSCEIPFNQEKSYALGIVCKRGAVEKLKEKISFLLYMPLADNLELFLRKEGWLLSYDQKSGRMIVQPDSFMARNKLRIKREKNLLFGDRLARKAFLVRGCYYVLNALKKKEIWLISDRINRGDDNGECFFRYLSDHPQKDVNAYFVVDKACPAYARMKQYGKVIPVFSWKHKMFHLLSDYVISSQANKPVINPFGRFYSYYSDFMYDKKMVFLQHGVTKDDQSAWLNRYNRNLYGFVVATHAEYNSIFEADYFYSEKNVWLTGFPRFDRLYRNEKKYITIMPTWRKSLSAGTTSAGEWTIGDWFAESDYFRFYNGLLNSERLINAAQERGYTICFMPHPNITPALPLFGHDERVIFWDADKSYRDVFAESNLIVTDYSSVAFDFAYLRKPIVYCQFDRKEFFSGTHSYTEGYFDYQTDGFGEVVETLDSLVDILIEYMENGCALKDEYRERIENTFAYGDTDCSLRVLEKIRSRES